MAAAPKQDRDAQAPGDARSGGAEGVRDLMRAVLSDAIICLRARGPEEEREHARHWLASTVRTWPFSFESICDVLGLSASHLRRVLLGSRAALAGARRGESGTVDDIVRRLSTARMRGNRRTRVVATRARRRKKGGPPTAGRSR